MPGWKRYSRRERNGRSSSSDLYRISFWAKADGIKSGAVEVALTDTRRWENAGLEEVFSPGAQWAQFEFRSVSNLILGQGRRHQERGSRGGPDGHAPVGECRAGRGILAGSAMGAVRVQICIESHSGPRPTASRAGQSRWP